MANETVDMGDRVSGDIIPASNPAQEVSRPLRSPEENLRTVASTADNLYRRI